MLGKYKLLGYGFPSAQMPEVKFPVPVSLLDHIPYKTKKEVELFDHDDEQFECLQPPKEILIQYWYRIW